MSVQKNFFPNNLKLLRRKTSLNQTEVAEHLGKKKSTISSYENGNSYPDVDDLLKIADFFKIDLNSLVAFNLEMDFDKEGIIKSNFYKEKYDKNVPNDVRKMSRTNEMLTKSGENQHNPFTGYRERLENDPIFRQVQFLRREHSKGKEEKKYETIVNLAYPIYADFGKIIDYLYPEFNQEIDGILSKFVRGEMTKNDAFNQVDVFLDRISPLNKLVCDIRDHINEILISIVNAYPKVYPDVIAYGSFDSLELAKIYQDAVEKGRYTTQGSHVKDKEAQSKIKEDIKRKFQKKGSKDDN